MASNDGSVVIRTLMDVSGFRKGMALMEKGIVKIGKGADSLQTKCNSLANRFRGLGKIIAGAFAVKQLTAFSKSAVEAGSDLTEVQNVVDTVFKSATKEVNEFASNAIEQFGLSETAAKRYASTLGAMLSSMGLSNDVMKEMSLNLTGLSADMASFYNLDTETAFEKIRAGISGETEPLKQLGINLSVANLEAFALAKGIQKSYSKMSQQEQVLLRYQYLLSVTGNAQGDFARTTESWANQTRILSERFKALKTTIGQGLINALTPALRLLNRMIARLAVFANTFKTFTEALFGNANGDSSATYEDATDSALGLAEATDDVAEATENANEANEDYLSGLDEINRYEVKETDIQDSIEDALNGSALGNGFELNLEKDVEEVGNQFGSFFDPLERAWKSKGSVVIEGARHAFEGLRQMAVEFGKTLAEIWNDGTIEDYSKSALGLLGEILFFIGDIGIAFANAWSNRGLDVLHNFFGMLTQINLLITTIAASFRKAFNEGAGQEMFEHILGTVSNWFAFGQNLALAFRKGWESGGIGDQLARDFFIVLNIFLDFQERLSASWAQWAKTIDFSPLLNSVHILAEAFKPLEQSLFDGLLFLHERILEPLASFVIEDVIPRFLETLANGITILSNCIEGLKPLFLWFWDSVLSPIASFTADAFLSAWDRINDVLKAFGDWCKANPKIVQGATVAIVAFFTAWKVAPLITAFGSFVSGAVSFISSIKSVAGALSLLKTGISAAVSVLGGPWTLAIAGAVAAGVLLWQNWDSIQKKVLELWGAVEPVWNQISGLIVNSWNEYIKPVFDEFGARFIEIWEGNVIPLLAKVQDVWASFCSLIQALWENILQPVLLSIWELVELLWQEVLLPFVTWLAQTIGPLIAIALEYIGNTFLILFETISNIVNDLLQVLQGVLDFLTGVFTGDWELAWSGIVQIFSGLWQGLCDLLSGVWNQILNIFSTSISYVQSLLGNFGSFVSGIWNGLVQVTANVWNTVCSIIVGAVNGLWNSVSSVFGWIAQTISNAWQNVSDTTRNIWNGIASFFKSPLNAIIGFLNGLLNGLGKFVNAFINAMNTLSFEVPDWVPFVGGKKFGFNFKSWKVPQIPMLADGGIIKPNNPFVAILGDQKSGTNIEAPASLIRTIVAEEATRAISAFALSKSGGGLDSVSSSNTLLGSLDLMLSKGRSIQNEWDQITKSMVQSLTVCVQNVVTLWNNLNQNTMIVFQNMTTSISNLMSQVLKNTSSMASSIVSILNNCWSNIQTSAAYGWNNLNSVIVKYMNVIIDNCQSFARTVQSYISSVMNNISSASSRASSYAASTRSYALDGGTQVVIPQAVIGKAPMLASGAVIPPNAPFVAVLGDQKSGNNLEAPESLIRKIFREEMGNQKQGVNGDIYLTVQAGSKKLLETVIDQAKLQQLATSRNPFLAI